VQAQLNTQINFMSAEMLAASKAEFHKFDSETDMEALERQQATEKVFENARSASTVVTKPIQFTAAKESKELSKPAPPKVVNPEKIELEDEEEEEEVIDELELQERQVPKAVFEKNVPSKENQGQKKEGALSRLKRKAQE